MRVHPVHDMDRKGWPSEHDHVIRAGEVSSSTTSYTNANHRIVRREGCCDAAAPVGLGRSSDSERSGPSEPPTSPGRLNQAALQLYRATAAQRQRPDSAARDAAAIFTHLLELLTFPVVHALRVGAILATTAGDGGATQQQAPTASTFGRAVTQGVAGHRLDHFGLNKSWERGDLSVFAFVLAVMGALILGLSLRPRYTTSGWAERMGE